MEYGIAHDEQVAPLELQLTEREAQLLDVMQETATEGEWFKKGDHDWQLVDGRDRTVLHAKYAVILKKFEAHGIVEHNGRKKAGSRYRFTDQLSRMSVTVKPQRKSATELADERRQQVSANMMFAGELVTSMEAYLDQFGNDGPTDKQMRAYVAEGLWLSRTNASRLIGVLVAKRHFHYDRIGKQHVMRAGPAPIAESLAIMQEPLAWSMADYYNAQDVFDYLLHFERLKNGAAPEEIVNRLGIVDGQRETFFATIRKLHMDKYISPIQGVLSKQGSQSTRFIIDDKTLVDRLRYQRRSVLDELLERVVRSNA